jgi:glycosyltransferase involved in cell wall biosynthesis
MKPLVSILMPAYNAERWIRDSVQSALQQTWDRTEVIIVDDGSRDGTLTAAKEFESAKVKVVSQPNQGAAVARNHALSISQGDYIQWLDADDLLAPDKIALQMEALARGGKGWTVLSSEWGAFNYRPHRARFEPTDLWCDLSPVEWLIRKLRDNLSMQTATWLVSRELTEAAGPWDVRLLADDDGEYFSRVVACSTGVQFVPGSRIYYRRALPSLSHISIAGGKLDAQVLTLELYVKLIRSLEDSARVREACISMLNEWRMLFFPERMDLYRRLESVASELDSRLADPKVPWKYSLVKHCFGWSAAKQAQFLYNQVKTSFLRKCDHILYQVERICASAAHRSDYGSLLS